LIFQATQKRCRLPERKGARTLVKKGEGGATANIEKDFLPPTP